MKIFVISLATSIERRAVVREQLDLQGVAFEFFDALPGAAGALTFFERYDENEYLLNCGRPAASGEIGCYASHRTLWRRCVESGEPIMIMEDDFLLAPDFSRAVSLVSDVIGTYGYLRLQKEKRGRKFPVASYGDFTVFCYTKIPHSCMCYALVPAVARALLERSRVLDAPVDVMVKKNWEHGCKLYGLAPYTVSEHRLACDTTIPGRNPHRKSAYTSLRRALRRMFWVFRSYHFNAR